MVSDEYKSFSTSDLLLGRIPLESYLPFFSKIKPTRFEGLVIEYEFGQIFDESLVKNGWIVVDAQILRRIRSSDGKEEYLIRLRKPNDREKLLPLVSALRKTGITVRQMALRPDGVFLLHDEKGIVAEPPIPLASPELWHNPLPAGVTEYDTTDEKRTLSMFWGFGSHIGDGFKKFAIDMVIKDYIVSPHSILLWDMDRFLIAPDGQVHYIEIKHKYPSPRTHAFGLNNGEIQQMGTLAKTGIRIWHLVLVKPRWDKAQSSMYLFFDRKAREKALWVGCDLTSDQMRSGLREGLAPKNTSIYGQREVKYKNIPVESFSLIGSNGDSSERLSVNLLNFLAGARRSESLSWDFLVRNRLP